MTLRKDKRIDNSEPLKILTWSLLAVILICLISYGYLIRGSIVNIVARQNMETQLSDLGSRVSDLETEYLKAEGNITPELATSMGFVAVADQKFVMTAVRPAPGLSVLTPGN